MKKLLYLLFFTLSLSVKSQITFDYSISLSTGTFSEKFTTTSLGDKFLIPLIDRDTLLIYNSDGSLYRTIILPTGYIYEDFLVRNGQGGNAIPSISDKLFNSDTLLEFIGTKINGDVSVINELGQILYTFPDSLSIINQPSVNIFTIDGNYRVRYDIGNESKIYSLPGSLPCNQCNFTSGIVEPNQGGGLSGLNVYPNPFNNSLEINYNFVSKQDNPRLIITDILGRELKTIPLVNLSDKLTINTTDLPRGTMIVSLYGNNQNPVSKKVIKTN